MKKLLTVPQGEHFAARIRSTMAALLIGLALTMTLWIATAPVVEAQARPTDQVALNFGQHLPPNTTAAKATKGQLVAAVTAAVKADPRNIGQYVKYAGQLRKGDIEDIVAAAIRALGRNPDCQLVAEAVDGGFDVDASKGVRIVELALRLAPNCTSEIQQVDRTGQGTDATDQGQGNFGGAPGNQNPPPGSISGGGGSQSGRCQVCHTSGNGKRQTLTISCNAVPAHIGHGDTEGPCPVTPTQNP